MEGRKRRMQKGRDDSKDYSNIQRAGIPTDEMWLDSGSLFGGVRRSPKTPFTEGEDYAIIPKAP